MSVGNIDADIDYFLTVVRQDPTVVRPHVVLIERDEKPPLLIVARLVHQDYPLKVGYRTLASPAAPTLLVAFDGVVGIQDDDDVATVMTTLSEHLSAGEADVVRFRKVDTSTTLFTGIERSVGWLQKSHGIRPTINWWAKLPGSWDDFLAARSSKSRRQLRYDDRKFEKKFSGSFEVRRLDAPEFRDRLRRDLEAVARTSYQRRLGVGIDASPLWEGLIALTLDRGWLRVWMLYIDDRPVAFWWGTTYAGVFADYSPAYDPEFSAGRVGTYTMMRMLENLCDDSEVSLLDFGHGEAFYKQRFGSYSTNTTDVLVFARRLRPLALNAVVSLASSSTGAAKALIARSERLKDFQRRIRALARGQTEDREKA
jgi:CelD/BcsL family acetyltransferase involved in cellulose biosynthesis